MLKALKEFERHAQRVFSRLKKDLPGLRTLTADTGYPEIKMTGFLHEGDKCKHYTSIEELNDYTTEARENRLRSEILYRKF